MGLFAAPDRPLQKPKKRSGPSLLLFLLLVCAALKLLGTPHQIVFNHPAPLAKPAMPILTPLGNDASAPPQIYHFTGNRVNGNGTYINLGDRRIHLPASLLSKFFPAELILPSCLTQLPVPGPAMAQLTPRPVRDDWPGFYGAPWIAHLNGNLVALLHVYAPRHSAVPVPPTEFQIYPDYNGQQTFPALDMQAPATFQRGSKAVLYRVFLDAPLRCLDLIVQNGENNGIGHLYYQKYHHYYELNTSFQILP